MKNVEVKTFNGGYINISALLALSIRSSLSHDCNFKASCTCQQVSNCTKGPWWHFSLSHFFICCARYFRNVFFKMGLRKWGDAWSLYAFLSFRVAIVSCSVIKILEYFYLFFFCLKEFWRLQKYFLSIFFKLSETFPKTPAVWKFWKFHYDWPFLRPFDENTIMRKWSVAFEILSSLSYLKTFSAY